MAEALSSSTAWLADPTVGRVVAIVIGLVLIAVVVRLARRAVAGYVQDSTLRYQARKAVSFSGYLAALVLVALVFSDRLGGLSVAFGVAGAGVAFALQEVIASVAGWVAVSFGGFYRVGDRVQLGGIKGDVEKASVHPAVTLVANQNGVEFTLRFVVDYKSRRTTKDRLFTRLLEEIGQCGDAVALAASTLNIDKLAPLEVQLRRAPR